MELTTVQQILLIILTSALAVLLVLSIAIAIGAIRLIRTLRLIAERTDRLVESAEAVGEVVKKAAGPLGILRVVQGLMEIITKHKQSKRQKRGE